MGAKPFCHPKDPAWGLAIAALSAPGAFIGAVMAFLGIRMGAGLSFLGVGLLSCAVLQLLGGLGVRRSRHRGFVLASAGAGLSFLPLQATFPPGALGCGAALAYGGLRLSRRRGAAPL